MPKIALGTVQFGLKYGIANQKGPTSFKEARRILKIAKSAGIDLLDTAIAYGKSEEILGKLGVEDFSVVTKLPPISNNPGDTIAWIDNQIHSSLERLRVDSIYALLLHHSGDLVKEVGKALIGAMVDCKSKGLVEKIGVSIYDPLELIPVMESMPIDIVQAPLNLVDRRLELSGWLRNLHMKGIEVHTRSTFLQGLLLMQRDEIPEKFARWSKLWDVWHGNLEKHNTSALETCLSYPLSLPEVSRVLVGVDSSSQLTSLIDAAQANTKLHDWSFMASDNPMLINPSYWRA